MSETQDLGGSPPEPKLPRVELDNIPADLRKHWQFVLWGYYEVDGKWTKRPKTLNWTAASTTDHRTWAPWGDVSSLYLRQPCYGIGFVVTADDPYGATDIDHCINPETGEISALASRLIEEWGSYTERTPSGHGVRIWGRFKKTTEKCKKAMPEPDFPDQAIEIYDRKRFFTLTGHHLAETPSTVEDCQAEAERLFAELWPPKSEPENNHALAQPAAPVTMDDAALLEWACKAKNGASIRALLNGDCSAYDGDESRASAALLAHLASYTDRDSGRMDRIMRGTPFGQREKWDSRRGDSTWGAEEISKAIERCTWVPTPPSPTGLARSAARNGNGRHGPEDAPFEEDAPASSVKDPAVAILAQFSGTELGNAERLCYRHGANLRYWIDRGEYLVWDGSRWKLDEKGQAMGRAKSTVRKIILEAMFMDSDEAREKRVGWAFSSERAAQLSAMLRLAQTEPNIPVLASELDADPMLFNVRNGTIDLRTGALRESRREDLITKQAPVELNPDATCPQWEMFLKQAMAENEEMISYLQRVAGCLLTGQPADRVFWFLYGKGGNGKSTFTGILHDLLGEYARKTSADTLLQKQGGDGIPNDLAELKGARLVTSAELTEARRLNEARIKDLTGRDIIKARFLRQEFFEFVASFKLFMYGNHRPFIRGTDDGIWDRVKLVPFTVTIPETERDPELPARLREELPGILNWALEGCRVWQEDGFQHPEAVRAATLAYKLQEDPLEDFLADACVIGPKSEAPNPCIWKAYEDWCAGNGEKYPLGRKQFTQRLEERGFRLSRDGKGRSWKGIGVMDTVREAPTTPSVTCDTSGPKNPVERYSRSHESTNRESCHEATQVTQPDTLAGVGDQGAREVWASPEGYVSAYAVGA